MRETLCGGKAVPANELRSGINEKQHEQEMTDYHPWALVIECFRHRWLPLLAALLWTAQVHRLG